jgi:hypothetical protein
MKSTRGIFSGGRRQMFLAALPAVLFTSALTAEAQTEKLNDGNSTVVINPSSGQLMTQWLVDGSSQLVLQGMYYRIGNVGGESALSTLSLISQNRLNGNTLQVTYGNGIVQIETTYTLAGGSAGSGTASISEQVKITNLTGNALDSHFFEYADFDLNGVSSGDTVQIGQNLQGFYNEALQTKGPLATLDTVLTTGANRAQVGSFPNLLNSLNDGSPTTLNNSTGPLSGDVTWAFQWDRLIAAGGSLILDIDKNLVTQPIPEPSTFAFGALGLALLLGKRRVQK